MHPFSDNFLNKQIYENKKFTDQIQISRATEKETKQKISSHKRIYDGRAERDNF